MTGETIENKGFELINYSIHPKYSRGQLKGFLNGKFGDAGDL